MHKLGLREIWTFTAYANRAAFLKGRKKWTRSVKNLIVTEGLNDNLTKYFKGSSYTAAWYVGLINNANFSALAATDTAAKITTSTPTGGTNGWKESTDYSESVRQTLTLGSAASGTISNSASLAMFTINGTVTIKGGFLASSSTKGGTAGVLFGEAGFTDGPESLINGNIFTVQVDIAATSV